MTCCVAGPRAGPPGRKIEMARKVIGGLIQCTNALNDPNATVPQIRDAMFEKHLPMIEEAGKRGVQILGLQEIFNGP